MQRRSSQGSNNEHTMQRRSSHASDKGKQMQRRSSHISNKGQDMKHRGTVDFSSDDEDNERQPESFSESQEATCKSESQVSHSGFSQDFFDMLNLSAADDNSVSTLATSSEIASSIGVVCVVSRPTNNKKQKDIKKFALQKTFYAYPKNCDTSVKDKIEERIKNDIADFKFQKYNVETYRFGLPFEVEEVCCVSRGYNLLPKILKAPQTETQASAPVKREKRKARSRKSYEDDSANSDDDDDYTPKTRATSSKDDADDNVPCKKKRA